MKSPRTTRPSLPAYPINPTPSRIPALSTLEVTQPAAIAAWFRTLQAAGLLYHPDDDPEEVVHWAICVYLPTFTMAEVEQLREIMPKIRETVGDVSTFLVEQGIVTLASEQE